MDMINLSSEPDGKLYSWLPHDLEAECVIFLPDACPGKSPLPTGTAVLTRQSDWRRFAVSDCGCGMRLVRSELAPEDLTRAAWDDLATAIRRNKGGLGDLGGGNHFVDALAPTLDNRLHLLIHTGSRAESGHVDKLVASPTAFDVEFDRVSAWAVDNRAEIHATAERIIGPLELLLDLTHNSYEKLTDGGVVIRKGAVRVTPGEINVIPSHVGGGVALVRTTDRVGEILNSLSHGTGRECSRADCKPKAADFDFPSLRDQVIIPSIVADSSLRTEGPYAYRNLDVVLALLAPYVEEMEHFKVIAYMGHL